MYKRQGHGLPAWFLKKVSKNALALDENGNIISPELVSFLSDEYLHYAYLWYDKIMPIIAENQQSNSGPIVMMQVCNEVGVFQWLSGRVDYNESVINLYKEFLVDKYLSLIHI